MKELILSLFLFIAAETNYNTDLPNPEIVFLPETELVEMYMGDSEHSHRPTDLWGFYNLKNKKIYLQNFKIGGMPQQAISIGFKYNAPKYWYTGFNFNYFADIYLSPNPDRRTSEAIAGLASDHPYIDDVIDQTKLENGNAINYFIGKSWKINRTNTYLRLNLNINNILDNTSFKTGGFEQLRYNPSNIQQFPNRYGYMYGRTYFIMLSYLF